MSSAFKSTTKRFVSPLPQLRETRVPADSYKNLGTPSATRKRSLAPVSSPALCTRNNSSADISIILPWDQSPVQIPDEAKESLSAKAASVLKDVSNFQEKKKIGRFPEAESLESSTRNPLTQKSGFQKLAPALHNFDNSVLRSSTVGCLFSTDDPQLPIDDSGSQVSGALAGQRELVRSPVALSTDEGWRLRRDNSGSQVCDTFTGHEDLVQCPVAFSTNEEWRRITENSEDEELTDMETQSEFNVATERRASLDQSLVPFEPRETARRTVLTPIQSLSSPCEERKRESLGSVTPDNDVGMPSTMRFVVSQANVMNA